MNTKPGILKNLIISVAVLAVLIIMRPLILKLPGGEGIIGNIGFLILPSFLYNLFLYFEIMKDRVLSVLIVTLAVLTSQLIFSGSVGLHSIVTLLITLTGGVLCAFLFVRKKTL